MLLIDGHSSHANMAFINACDRLRILLLILPPHSTQRLQPLDVSLFLPLATYYTNGLNDLTFKSLGLVSMSTRSFWKVFWPAWNQAFSAQNIASAFKKTGVWPYNPAIILNAIIIPPIEDTATTIQAVKTATTCRAVRRFQKHTKRTQIQIYLLSFSGRISTSLVSIQLIATSHLD